MELNWWRELSEWWQSLPALFVYLFMLPFAIGLLGLVVDRLRSARR